MTTADKKALTKDQLIDMLETKEEVLTQLKALHDQEVRERDAKLEALQLLIDNLVANNGRKVRREDPVTVKELPKLVADPKTSRAVCPLVEEHGSVTPNVRGLCPKCYTHAVWAASPAGQAALKTQAEAPVETAAPEPVAA
jgi:hypothetical protein